MHWKQYEHYIEADSGHRIAITRTGSTTQYSAFAPEVPYNKHKLTLRTQYPQGLPVPQQRALLGVFDTEQEARTACRSHKSPHPPEI